MEFRVSSVASHPCALKWGHQWICADFYDFCGQFTIEITETKVNFASDSFTATVNPKRTRTDC